MTRAARYLALVALAIAASIVACRNSVPPPALPAPVAPEVSRDAPKSKPIDPTRKKKPAKVTMREMPTPEVHAAHQMPDAGIDEEPLDAAPTSDAEIIDVLDMPEVPDAEGIVTEPGTPLE